MKRTTYSVHYYYVPALLVKIAYLENVYKIIIRCKEHEMQKIIIKTYACYRHRCQNWWTLYGVRIEIMPVAHTGENTIIVQH